MNIKSFEWKNPLCSDRFRFLHRHLLSAFCSKSFRRLLCKNENFMNERLCVTVSLVVGENLSYFNFIFIKCQLLFLNGPTLASFRLFSFFSSSGIELGPETAALSTRPPPRPLESVSYLLLSTVTELLQYALLRCSVDFDPLCPGIQGSCTNEGPMKLVHIYLRALGHTVKCNKSNN